MSYDTYETSVDAGSPYFLYLFDNGVTETRFTSEPEALTRMGESWTPSPVSHGELEQTGDIEKSATEVTFPLSDTFGRTFLAVASEITTVTIWRGHREDVAEELRVVWKGRVVGARDRGNTIEVSIESVFTSMRRTGCRARTQRTCRHALYHDGCTLNRADFETAGTVTAVNGLVLTITEAAAAPAGDFKAGIVNFGGVMGFVTSHVGDQVTLLTAIAGLADEVTANGSAAVMLAPGCNLTRSRCNDRFNNSLNFGGFDRMPDNNPFTISIV